jgi:hypothetical protein
MQVYPFAVLIRVFGILAYWLAISLLSRIVLMFERTRFN